MSDPVEDLCLSCVGTGYMVGEANNALDYYRAMLAAKEKAEGLRDLYQGELGKCKFELSEMAEDCTSWMERAEKAEAERDIFAERCSQKTEELIEMRAERDRLRERTQYFEAAGGVGMAAKIFTVMAERDRLRGALEEIANHKDCNFVGGGYPASRQYAMGVKDGHRCAADIARNALAGVQGEREASCVFPSLRHECVARAMEHGNERKKRDNTESCRK